MALSACVSPVAGPGGNYAHPIGDAPVTANPTPYSAALVCLSEYARAHHLNSPRIAVGQIADYTGKEESDGSGRKLTQGASLMAMSRPGQGRRQAGRALRHLRLRDGAEIRQQQADQRRPASPAPHGPSDYRKILAG